MNFWLQLVFGLLAGAVCCILIWIFFGPVWALTGACAWFFVALMMLWLTDVIVSRFDIHGFWTLVGATLIAWLVNLGLDRALFDRHGGSGRSRAALTIRS